MEGNNTKILLNKERSVESVNENAKIEFTIDNTNKLIPLNNINVTVSAYQQFLKEREESKIYRFYGVINAVVANPLYNDNIEILSGGTTHKIKSNEIFENNGWVGFFSEPTEELQQFNDNESDLCNFVPFAPGYDRLNVLDHDGVPNYKILITYPAYSSDTIQLVNDTTNNTTLKNGVPIIQKLTININGRNYVGFKTLINHGLKEMDSIRLYNFIDNSLPYYHFPNLAYSSTISSVNFFTPSIVFSCFNIPLITLKGKVAISAPASLLLGGAKERICNYPLFCASGLFPWNGGRCFKFTYLTRKF